ncbi:MAG: hypothetical protein ACJ72J_02230, partial [Nitrososphaeraceae archaeon]
MISSVVGMQLVYNNFFEEYNISIDKYSIELVKVFLNAGIQIIHSKNLTPMNFAVDDRYFLCYYRQVMSGETSDS